MAKRLSTFFGDECGATMVEYAVMLVMISAVCIAVIVVIGSNTGWSFSMFNAEWSDAGAPEG